MTDDGKRISRQVIEEVFNKGRLDLIDELIAPGYTGHDPALPQDITGPDGQREIVAGYRAAFPDLAISIDDQIAEGDRVVTRWTARGTHTGDLWGIAGTGKQATVTGTTIDRIQGGQIVQSWINWDALGLMQQLGVVPAMAQI
jgi:steroid delta-isomerase-like uncharacterized protein